MFCLSVCLPVCVENPALAAAGAQVHKEALQSTAVEHGSVGHESDDAEQENMCVVCWTLERETTLAPCGHRVLCR